MTTRCVLLTGTLKAKKTKVAEDAKSVLESPESELKALIRNRLS